MHHEIAKGNVFSISGLYSKKGPVANHLLDLKRREEKEMNNQTRIREIFMHHLWKCNEHSNKCINCRWTNELQIILRGKWIVVSCRRRWSRLLKCLQRILASKSFYVLLPNGKAIPLKISISTSSLMCLLVSPSLLDALFLLKLLWFEIISSLWIWNLVVRETSFLSTPKTGAAFIP